MAGHRQSALLLHGLSEPDRCWILERLGEEDQHILSEYLAELKSLGIPVDPAMIDAVRSSGPTDAGDPLHAASTVQIQALLADEPVWLIRHVLALDDWPWRQNYLEALAPGQRERLMASRQAPLSGKAAERLRWQLAQRLARFDIAPAENRAIPPARRGLFHAVRQAVRQWL